MEAEHQRIEHQHVREVLTVGTGGKPFSRVLSPALPRENSGTMGNEVAVRSAVG